MNRRNFVSCILAFPFSHFIVDVRATTPLLLPHRLVLPGRTWETFASVAQATTGFAFDGKVATNKQAQKLSGAINGKWNDLPWFFNFYLGITPDDAAEQWLLDDGWERRVRIAEAFFRGGEFRIVPQFDGVELLRND